jgi:hypothetical protein
MNRYFIIDYPVTNPLVWDIVAETEASVRVNVAGDKCIVKFLLGDNEDHPEIVGTEYTHEGILNYLSVNNSEWSKVVNLF